MSSFDLQFRLEQMENTIGISVNGVTQTSPQFRFSLAPHLVGGWTFDNPQLLNELNIQDNNPVSFLFNETSITKTKTELGEYPITSIYADYIDFKRLDTTYGLIFKYHVNPFVETVPEPGVCGILSGLLIAAVWLFRRRK